MVAPSSALAGLSLSFAATAPSAHIKPLDPGFLAGKPISRSFKDALSGNSSMSASFPDLRPTTHRGMASLWISEDEIWALAAPFEFSLVGKFSLRRLRLDVLRQFFFNLKLTCDFYVTLLDPRHVLIRLSTDLDYSCVFGRRSYYVNNCQMRLLKWSPLFDINEESPIIPVWIAFLDLRPHLFSHKILHGLGSLFGHPLQIDSATANGSHPSFARVLVKMDITKNFPSQIWLGPESLRLYSEG